MRKAFTIFFLITLSIQVFGNESEIEERFNKIITDLDVLISKSPNKNKYVEDTFIYVREKLKKQEIKIVFDSTLNYSFRGCASSNIVDSINYSLSIGKFVIDAYEKFPYLVYGILIHEFQHLYDFSTNRKLIEISLSNPIEHTYFEIDALMNEALFLKNYANKKANLTPIETYLVMDLENNLAGSAILFEKVDLNLLHAIDAISRKKISFEEGKKEYIKIGEEICKSMKFNDNAWNNYCNVITLKTYSFYSRQILHDLLFTLSNVSLNNDQLDLKNYPDVFEIIKKVQSISKKNESSFAYYEETMKMFENYISSKMK